VVTGPKPEPLLQKWKESEGHVPVHEDEHGVYWVGREAFSFFLNSLISFHKFLFSILIITENTLKIKKTKT
jgi:hypothetical protein